MSLELLADAYGLTDQAADDGAVMFWKQAVEEAKRDVELTRTALLKDAYDNRGFKSPVGTLICEMDFREYQWLKAQYGEDIMKDRDFLLFYQKHRGQQFLGKPSKELWN